MIPLIVNLVGLIVVLAALTNALRCVDKKLADVRIVVAGGGAAGSAIVTLLLAGGAKGKRMSLPNSRILIHQVSGGFQGQGTDIEIQAREVIGLKRRLEEIYAFHTGKSQVDISRDMERDFFMSPQEGGEYGIIDSVITHRDAARAEAAA